ncbi:MAG: helix-turn-helix domain-containing protein [Candidatus Thorarchaeota archaeon]
MASDDGQIVEEVKETTLRVYFELMKNDDQMTLREVQRRLHLSSPSLALYHLNKLKDLGLVEMSPEGGYRVARQIKIGALRFFLGRGRFMMPRYLFYATFFSAELIGYLLVFGFSPTPLDVLLILTLMAALAFSVWEALMMWRSQPAGFRT